MTRQEAHRVDGHILEFVGDDVAMRGKGREARLVVPRRLRVLRGDLRGDTFPVGRVDMDVIAKLRRSDGEHTAELAATKNADRRTGWEQNRVLSLHERGWGRRCSSGLRASH